MKFLDEVTIRVSSGKGGPGCVSFRREALVPRGGPDGGDGGNGGSIIFRVDPRITTLIDLRLKREYRAQDGEKGRGANQAGANGSNLFLHVPPGTLIKDDQGMQIIDLTEVGDWVFLQGGLGGKGNTFYKSSVNQAPSVAQKGLPGESREITLELKLLADVGIIGLPNAGKSTLISHLSSAKPKIADYPFTTLVPNLGVVKWQDRSFVIADIPGLVEGAHLGVGLGMQFLRHIERCKMFVHLIDIQSITGKKPLEAFLEIQQELMHYDKKRSEDEGYFEPLMSRPQIVVLNKCDTVSSTKRNQVVKQLQQKGIRPLCISAVSGENLKELLLEIGKKIFSD